MCGIVGMVFKGNPSSPPFKVKDIFKELMFVDQLRGEHSTGAFSVTRKGNAHWVKGACGVKDFFKDEQVDDFIEHLSWDYKAVVGHNRKATKGAITDENAHPFVEDDVVLVHNGTLTSHKQLKDVEVDSHAIAHSIKEIGILETINKINGAWALSIYETKKKLLTLLRNKERPLWLAETKDYWIFASEFWMIDGIAWRNDEKIIGDIKLLDVDTMYTFDMSKEDKVSLKKESVHPKKSLPIPVEVKETKKLKNSSTTSLNAVLSEYRTGDIITFYPHKIRFARQAYVIKGAHSVNKDIIVEARMPANMNYGEVEELNSMSKLKGTIYSIFGDSSINRIVFLVKDVDVSEPLLSKNGVELDEEDTDKMTSCDKCHKKFLSFVSYEDATVVETNGKKSIYCKSCKPHVKLIKGGK